MKTAFLKTEIKMCQKNAFSHSFQKKQKNKKTLQRKEKAWGGGGGDFNLGFEPFLKKKLNKHAHIEM